MADRLKPENKEAVKQIRELEKEIAQKHDFKRYHNYYFPENIVKTSSTVVTFGVGGDVACEKLMCIDNDDLRVFLHDPTPYTKDKVGDIILASGNKRYFKKNLDYRETNKKLAKKFTYNAVGYSKTNGSKKFYFPTERYESGMIKKQEDVLNSYSTFDVWGQNNFVKVDFQNLETTLNNLKMDKFDILKTDIEGNWYDCANEMKHLNIKFRAWACEFELNVGDSFENNLEKTKEVCSMFKDTCHIYVNKERLKRMMELIFINKNES